MCGVNDKLKRGVLHGVEWLWIAILPFTGCVGERYAYVTTVPEATLAPVEFDVPLKESTRAILFVGFENQTITSQWLRVTVTNYGEEPFETRTTNGTFDFVQALTDVEIYNDFVPTSTYAVRFPVTSIRERTSCKLRVELLEPAEVLRSIDVYRMDSSAPL